VSILGYGISLLTQPQACQVISLVNSLIFLEKKFQKPNANSLAFCDMDKSINILA
jgi:hypothetical protein